MIHSPVLSHRMTQRINIVVCVSALWFSISCDAKNRHTTTTRAFDPPRQSQSPRFVPHEALIKFKSGISPERIASILKENRIDVIAEIQRGHLYHVRVLDDQSVESAIARLTSYQEIEYAEPNYQYEMQK